MTASELDVGDALAGYRDQFLLPAGPAGAGSGLYFCGHSLGPQPRAAAARVTEELARWAELGVEGHFRGAPAWAGLAQPLAAISAGLVGAATDEVAVMNALTVNLHLLLASFYRPRGERRRILIERPAFPSDRYAVASHLRLHGFDPAETLIEVGPRPGEGALREDELCARIAAQGERLALVLLGGVNYATGQALPLPACARAAHAVGAVAGFDLAHAIGNVPIALDASGADFAVWCGYKYLNGGPGAPAGCFIARRHWEDGPALPRLAGWWGHRAATRFAMPHEFEPEAGAAGWAVSSPTVLALAGLRAGLDLFERVGMPAIRRKSIALLAFFDRACDAALPGLPRWTPREMDRRGAQVSLDLGPQAAAVQQRLRAEGVYCDVRGPVLRLSFNPLYNRFAEIERCVELLAQSLSSAGPG